MLQVWAVFGKNWIVIWCPEKETFEVCTKEPSHISRIAFSGSVNSIGNGDEIVWICKDFYGNFGE